MKKGEKERKAGGADESNGQVLRPFQSVLGHRFC